jgi:hypothetical protein
MNLDPSSESPIHARRIIRAGLALIDGKAPDAAPWLRLQALEEMLRLLHLPNVDRLHALRCEIGDAAVHDLAGDLLRDVWARERMDDARCVEPRYALRVLHHQGVHGGVRAR